MSTQEVPRVQTGARSRQHWLAVGLALLLIGGVVAAQVLARGGPAPAAVGALHLVDRTTLVVVAGDVQLQPLTAASFEPVQGQRPLQVGDRVRTGASGYASIVYFDGSATALEPHTEIVLQRFERDPVTGATAIIVQQPIGTTWTQAAASGHPFSGFLLANEAGRFFARGAQFTAEVAPEGTTAVSVVEGSVLGRADGQDVEVPAGYMTRVRPGQRADAPVPITSPAATLHIRVDGPVKTLLTDGLGRSLGQHPDADVAVSQIPGARATRDGAAQVLIVPGPVEAYELTLRGQGSGDIGLAIGALRGGETAAPAAVVLSGRVAPGEVQNAGFLWKDGQVRDARALAPAQGTPARSVVAALKNPPPALAVAPTSTPVPAVAEAGAEPDSDATIARAAPVEPEASDVFSSIEAPVAPLRPEVVAPVLPTRPSVVTAPAPPVQAVRPSSPPQVVRAPERDPRPPVVRGLADSEDGPPTAAPAAVAPTTVIQVVTATPLPPTPVPPTPLPTVPPPPTQPPPTPLPTVPPTVPPPAPTSAPARAAPQRPATQPQNNRPAIAPTATPYVAPAGPTRCPPGAAC